MPTLTAGTRVFRWASDLRHIALTEGADALHRSWVMLLPQGSFEHPKGTLDLSRRALSEMQANFEAGVRGVEIALDYDHQASEGDSRAPGWIEQVMLCDRGKSPDGKPTDSDTPAGMWGLIRWTRIGLDDVQGQIFRYISAEYRPEWTNPVSGKTFKNVLIGATLTNRPFMNHMPAITLSDVSTRAWGSVDKSCLPDSAFLDPTNRRLPIYEGAGPKDAKGRYTQRGKLNINGARAALAAIHGAHTGKAMSGLPAGAEQRLSRLLARYSGNGKSDDGDGDSKKAGEAAMATNRERAAALLEDLSDEDLDELLAEYEDGESEELDASGADDGGAEDAADGGDDEDTEDDSASAQPNPKAKPARKRGAVKGKGGYGRGKGSKTMSEEQQETVNLREQFEAQAVRLKEAEIKLREAEVKGTLDGWTSDKLVVSKALRDEYRAIMLSDTVREDEQLGARITRLVEAAFKGAVDLSTKSASFDMESHRDRRTGESGSDQDVVELAEKEAQAAHGKGIDALANGSAEERKLAKSIIYKAAGEVGFKLVQ